MKTKATYRFLFLLLALFSTVVSCGKQPGDTFTYGPNGKYVPSDTVSFASSIPNDNTSNVPLNQPLQFQFSAPISVSSLQDGISIRVMDDSGAWIQGDISTNSSQDQVLWTPRFNGRRVSFDPATNYRA